MSPESGDRGRVKIGVVGVGALGQHHARVAASLPGTELVGVYDVRHQRALEVVGLHGGRAFDHLRDLVAAVDAVVVAVPTVDHLRVGRACLESGRPILVEKPIATTLREADDLLASAQERGLILQVGHVERFNPAAEALRGAGRPHFIEVHRLGAFPNRSLDIDVVLDLMIHDLDLVLALDPSEVVQVDAVGVPVLTPKVDIANARLRLASGLIANLTASRVSVERVRKFRIFAPGTYVSADLAARRARVYRLVPGAGGPQLSDSGAETVDEEPLLRQMRAFVQSVRDGRPPVVSGGDGRRALELALLIADRILTTSSPA